MASLTMHHWADQQKGLAEMRRVARRLVLFTFDIAYMDAFWLVRDYVPEIAELDRSRFPPIEQIAEWMGGAVREVVVPVAERLRGRLHVRLLAAARDVPRPRVRAGISTLAVMPDAVITRLVIQLSDDLETGRWLERNEDILELDELDLGYRILCTDIVRYMTDVHPGIGPVVVCSRASGVAWESPERRDERPPSSIADHRMCPMSSFPRSQPIFPPGMPMSSAAPTWPSMRPCAARWSSSPTATRSGS